MQAGVVRDNSVLALGYPTLLELLRDPDGLNNARAVLDPGSAGQEYIPLGAGLLTSIPEMPIAMAEVPLPTPKAYTLHEVVLYAPIPDPPSMRDFYAFEQHVKSARTKRGLGMIPEWYEIPTFYFTNTSEIYGHDHPVPYPVGSQELDFELEIACVIGQEGKDIPLEEADQYIAGYTIMNDWSARDFQRKDMKLNLGPGKGKDFATSLGPWLVTPDELASRRSGSSAGELVSPQDAGELVSRRQESGADERYDMTMIARVNGKEISRGNFNQIYYSFPQMIAYASRNARLRAGDVLGSGTVGTGCKIGRAHV